MTHSINSDNNSVTLDLTQAEDRRLMDDALLLRQGRHPDPFAVLGRHGHGDRVTVRWFMPGVLQVWLVDVGQPMGQLAETGLFEWHGGVDALPLHYQLMWMDADGREYLGYDPYSFAPQLSLYDLHLFNEGRHLHAYRVLGAHPRQVDGIAGTLFSVWAPNAERVSVVGDFNNWDGRRHPLRRRGYVWELFMPGVGPGTRYQFEIRVAGYWRIVA